MGNTSPLSLSLESRHAASIAFSSISWFAQSGSYSFMSRICVKNLPKYVDDKKLREIFSEKGEVTDAKVMRTKDGKTRQLAFIGFRTELEAQKAIQHFNRNFIGTLRITCEPARKIGDPPETHHRPWSRHSKEKRNTSSVSYSSSRGENDGDPELEEFLHVMQPRVKTKLWANDTTLVACTNDQRQQKRAVSMEEAVSDMDYFQSRVKRDWSEEEEGLVEDSNAAHKERSNTWKEEEEDPNRLFVTNLPYTATEDEVEELFSKFGTAQVHVLVDKDTNSSKGIAFVLYKLPESAKTALQQLHNSTFQGRLLQVTPSRPKKKMFERPGDDQASTTSFKQEREEERKASEINGDTRPWNSLFISSETAVDIIAHKYGVSKSDFFDRDADDVAVRVAQAETDVIAQTKKALEKAGVNVESLENFAARKAGGSTDLARSNRILLVKALPTGSSESELANMFGKFGVLEKIIMPSPKTLALVCFFEPSSARAAFNYLAFKKYKDKPLKLEWAPANVLRPSSTPVEGNVKNNAAYDEHDVKRVMSEHYGEGPDDLDPDRVESRTLYVKNLSFKTSSENFKKHISEQMMDGQILSVKLKMHSKTGNNVGFGFLEFDSVRTATNVCRDLQGTIFDGHHLKLEHCNAKQEVVPQEALKDKSPTKIIVKDLAFEATKKNLRQLLSPYGEIKSLRLPINRTGRHRGFAFVEFFTKQETERAIQALASTHFYGRRLVLERANKDESLQELRDRIATQFPDDQTCISQKRKPVAALDEGQMD